MVHAGINKHISLHTTQTQSSPSLPVAVIRTVQDVSTHSVTETRVTTSVPASAAYYFWALDPCARPVAAVAVGSAFREGRHGLLTGPVQTGTVQVQFLYVQGLYWTVLGLYRVVLGCTGTPTNPEALTASGLVRGWLCLLGRTGPRRHSLRP